MKVTNVKVYGLKESIVASGYPMLSKPLNEDEFEERTTYVSIAMFEAEDRDDDVPEWLIEETEKGNKHIQRAIKLAQAPSGSGHDCWLKGVIVQMDVNAPQYFWQELQRYHFIDFVSSMSKMHCITKFGDNMINKEVAGAIIDRLKANIALYNADLIDIDQVLLNVPMGLEYAARMTTNYLQLKTIYKQRRNHRSKQWQMFCDWIETLPMAKELIYAEKSL